ncbi:Sensor protein ZraS [Pseudobythopirellula maris]|uniref:histidine kinase n=1 Tax=Pseudobythopirellula maris TaxID=2527991 RepID=A0A5C5ZQM0_9BACT|nr:HAMP domain-containing sensor histidine kinase [Pseudobythopirellula maris]TWT89852.1 Sensor protein ZraS [Pseudobythopirellula maris]
MPRRPVRLPIRNQFLFPLVAVAVASLAAVAVVNAWLATSRTRDRVEHQLRGVAAVLDASRFPLTDAVLRQMRGLSGAEYLLLDESGNRVASSGEGLSPPSQPTAPPATGADRVVLGKMVTVADRRYYHSSMRLTRPSAVRAPRVLHVFFPRDEYNAAWRSLFLPPLVVGGATIAAVMLVTHLVASRISRALGRLGAEVSRLAGGDFSELEPPTTDDETRRLALAVNQTARRLAEYEQQVRGAERMRTLSTLGAGLAHEIRNAATGCRMAVDLHTEACPAAGPDDDTLEVARRQLLLMENRLQQLLRLGKEDDSPGDQEFDLVELVEGLVLLATPSAEHAGVALDWRAPDSPILVEADPQQLSQAVMNLLLNAMEAARRHAARAAEALPHAGAYVRIELTANARGAELLVADSGEGPSPEVSDSLFDPFVTDKPEGIGLGLAVTRRTVESCGGTIDWRRRSDDNQAGETQFVLRLPTHPSGAAAHG